MYKISQEIFNLITSTQKIKKSPKGWISFSGRCCIHNGESQDKRGRGGIIMSSDGAVNYHCFNCGCKYSFIPGRQLNRGMRKLLEWHGTDVNEIMRLSFESFRLKDTVTVSDIEIEKFDVDFAEMTIPGNVIPLQDPAKIEYLESRGFKIDDYSWLETDDTEMRNHQRIIIPFTHNNKIVGYTGRLAKHANSLLRYTLHKHPGYVFNLENQSDNRNYVLIHEGPMDAIATDGVSLMGRTIDSTQIDLIEDLNKQIIVVPDRESSGQNLINIALENHWGVAFPDWDNDVKDAAEAYKRYGKIYTLQSILCNIETYSLKIDYARRKFA